MRIYPGLAALLAAVMAVPAAAAASFYNVEIVVFEHVDPASGASERWRPEVVVPPIADAAAFEAGGPRAAHLRELPEGFERLPFADSELGGAVARLNDSGRYRVLRHSIWRQPALDEEDAVALRFSAGEPMTVRIPGSAYPAGPIEPDAAQAADTGEARALRAQADSPSTTGDRTHLLESPFGLGMRASPLREAEVLPLDGTVKLVVSRYLHLRANLHFTAPVEWTGGEEQAVSQAAATGTGASRQITRGPDGQAILSYGFHQERRMRSGELHYLDHPVLGLLVKVTPHEGAAGG